MEQNLIGPVSTAWFQELGLSQADVARRPMAVYGPWLAEGLVRSIAPKQWMVFGYHAVRSVLMGQQFIKFEGRQEPELPPAFQHLPPLEPSMLFSNPTRHTRLRSLVTQAFQPRHLERLRPFIQTTADHLADTLVAAGGGDLVTDYAFALPALVIAELLGVPTEDRAQFRVWSQQIALLLDPSQAPQVRRAGALARLELLEYFHQLIETKRHQGGDDLLTSLIAAEDAGDRLSPGELLSMALILLVAGHETTTNLISMGALTLMHRPDALGPVLSGDIPWASAVEELLRYESPVQMDARVNTASVELEGITMEPGSAFLLVLAAANRDPAVFEAPDELLLDRKENPHLAFGRGIHFCLGASLARMEGAIAFQSLFRRGAPKLAGEPDWNANLVLRGLKSLPVQW